MLVLMKPHSQTESKPFKNTWQVLVQNYKSFVVTIPYFNLIFISSALSYSIVIPYLINIKSTPPKRRRKRDDFMLGMDGTRVGVHEGGEAEGMMFSISSLTLFWIELLLFS